MYNALQNEQNYIGHSALWVLILNLMFSAVACGIEVLAFILLTPRSDQCATSPYNINTF